MKLLQKISNMYVKYIDNRFWNHYFYRTSTLKKDKLDKDWTLN